MTIDLQPITQQDIPMVEKLAYDYSDELYLHRADPEVVARWFQIFSQDALAGKHCFWLGRVDGAIAGFVCFQIRTNIFTQEMYGFLEDIYIVPKFRRRGYGELLARTAFTELYRCGASKIQLDVLAHNEPAFMFWQKLGLGLDHYVLTMPLDISYKE